MTRNPHSKRDTSSIRSSRTDVASSNGDQLVNLPDLSGLREEEKRHILNVLLRDENLRNKHLARFMQLRKEVADLEQQPQPTSTSVCARCQTPFGYIFNTGDTCPKCGAKVCKQCRLMYNVNDNGWLCQLCCKQMQLMSYSGEWIYSLRSNLRKDSVTASEMVRKSLSPSISMQNLDDISSSDTETESTVNSSERRGPVLLTTTAIQQKPPGNLSRMVVQSSADEQKLNSLKQNVQQRPQLQPRDFSTTYSSALPGGSSDDVDSLFDHSPIPTARNSVSSNRASTQDAIPKNSSSRQRLEPFSATSNGRDVSNNSNRRSKANVDCASVTSSEWGGESERGESSVRESSTSKKRGSKLSLASRMHISGSINSLRDAVHSKRHISSSRTSLNADEKSKPDVSNTISTKTPDQEQDELDIEKLNAVRTAVRLPMVYRRLPHSAR